MSQDANTYRYLHDTEFKELVSSMTVLQDKLIRETKEHDLALRQQEE